MAKTTKGDMMGKLGDTIPPAGVAAEMRLAHAMLNAMEQAMYDGMPPRSAFQTMAAAIASGIINVGVLGESPEEVLAAFEKTFADVFKMAGGGGE